MIGTLEQKKLGLERLEKLAAHLKSGHLGHEKFNFNQFHIGPNPRHTRCGTEGCAIGECPFVFPQDWDFYPIGHVDVKPKLNSSSDNRYFAPLTDAANFFFLEEHEASRLFMPFNSQSTLDDKATPAQVAANIRDFIRGSLDNTVAPSTSNSL